MERRPAIGLTNKEADAISRNVRPAPARVAERKKIQATTVRENVRSILNIMVGILTKNFGELAGLARGSPMNVRGMTYRPLSMPQTMKVQFAPCQKPLNVK